MKKTRNLVGPCIRLVLGLCLAAMPIGATAQGKAPFYLEDKIVYGDRDFMGYFSLFEREDVRAAPDTGLPQKEWIEQSSMTVYALDQPDLTKADRALALKLARAFCKHHGLTVKASPGASTFSGAEWSFTDLCWKAGW